MPPDQAAAAPATRLDSSTFPALHPARRSPRTPPRAEGQPAGQVRVHVHPELPGAGGRGDVERAVTEADVRAADALLSGWDLRDDGQPAGSEVWVDAQLLVDDRPEHPVRAPGLQQA